MIRIYQEARCFVFTWFVFVFLFFFFTYPAFPQAREPALSEEKPTLAFATYVGTPHQEYAAAMLIASIRSWGGKYRDNPIYVVITDPAISGMHLRAKKIEVLRLKPADSIQAYPFAVKALAAAEVEKAIDGKISSLAWFDPETLLFRPPEEMDLPVGISAAVNPVHFTGIGQTESEPIDPFWTAVYRRCGLDASQLFSVQTMVDQRTVRAWLNCGIFSIRPDHGLLREWARILGEMIGDDAFQKQWVTLPPHRIFLHQAILSSLIVARMKRNEIHLFSHRNGYPLFCHNTDFQTARGTFQVPAEKKIRRLNEITSVFHESIWYGNKQWQTMLPSADEPLKKWLQEEYDRHIGSLQVAENLYREENSCNSYLMITARGGVLIDPSGAAHPKSMLRLVARNAPVQAILLTHAHEDHRQGIPGWKSGKDMPVIGQREMVEFLRYHDRLQQFSGRRTAAQTGVAPSPNDASEVVSPMEATLLFDDQYSCELGGTHFHFFHTGGETPDQSLIWVPERKAVFIGDSYYTSFPNLYTLRGTKPRWALGYIKALEKAIALEPEILLPGHGEPLIGKEAIRLKLTKYRDAILFVHDAVVRGMNEGKSVYTLMEQIRLPDEFQVSQFYGRVSWSVRGIYEGYAGWFDGNPAGMYEKPVASIYPDLVQLSGGVDSLDRKAEEYLQKGEPLPVLHLTDIALSADPSRKQTLKIRMQALQALKAASTNYIEVCWLSHFLRQISRQLE